MIKQTIFTDSLLIDYFNNEDFVFLKETINTTLEEKKKINEYEKKSNIGGFQTKDISREQPKLCEYVLDKIVGMIKASYKFNNIKLHFHNMWINENMGHHFNTPHVHPKCDYSGVFYIQTPKDAGAIHFIRNDKSPSMGPHEFIFNDLDFTTEYVIMPEPKMIILFPSYLQHMVLPHFKNESRISSSFNLSLESEAN
jgi:uncharacterized protein (TIGR02466 family)